MGDSSGETHGTSGISNLKDLLENVKMKYEKTFTNDNRWPCPFCLSKSDTYFQCRIHIRIDHPNIANQNTKEFFDQFSNLCDDDLLTETTSFDLSTSENQVICTECGFKAKNHRGLKIHLTKGCKNKKSLRQSQSHNTKPSLNYTSLNSEGTPTEPLARIPCPFSPNRTFINSNRLKIHLNKNHSETSTFVEIPDFQERLAKYKVQLKIVKRIPRGARNSVASKLSNVINKCVDTNTFESWKELSFFTYNVLHVKENKGINKKKRSLTSEIKKNTLKLPSEIPLLNPENLIRNSSSNIKYIEERIEEGDIRGAIRILSSEDSIAPTNLTTFQNLREKHPDAPPSFIQPEPLNDLDKNECLIVDKEDVRNGIFSFVIGSSGGEDGIRPQHLKDLISKNNGEMGEQLLSSVTNLCNLMLAGGINEQFVPYFYGATLIALIKKDGGIRPIAVGSTFRRLVAKCGCCYMKENLLSDFIPHQMGFGVKGGCEAVVHAVRTFIDYEDAEIIIKVDVSNAFNSAARDRMLQKIKTSIPALYPFFYQCYAHETYLCYGDNIILSKTGCQQGDPAGPGLFSLVINDSIKSLKSKLNVWFLDDGTLGGRAEIVLNDIDKIIKEFADLGLSLNSGKCEIFFNKLVTDIRKKEILEKLNHLLPGIKVISKENFTLLGAPITEEAVVQVLSSKLKTIQTFMEKVSVLNTHMAFFLIKNCLWIPKLMYLLRCSPMFKFKDILNTFDETIKLSLEKILNLNFTTENWKECILPVSFGGLGFRTTTDICIPAFISSSYSTHNLVGTILSQSSNDFEVCCLEEAIIAWKELCPETDLPVNGITQKSWDLPIVNIKRSAIFSNASSAVEKARLLAVQQNESGAWINALPSSPLGLLLDKETLRISICIRLGLKICEEHLCVCGSLVDETGRHGLSCLKIAGRYVRHYGLNGILKRSLGTTGFPAILEPPGLIHTNGKRPDGLTIMPWKRGRSLVWDATCVDTFAKSYLNSTSKLAGAAAKLAETKKFSDYEAICNKYEFIPFAVETMGNFGSYAKNFSNELGKLLILATDDKRAKSFFLQRISICIQRGNSASILATLPSSSSDKFNEIFYI